MQINEDNTGIVFSKDSFCFVVGKDGKALSLKLHGKELLCDNNTPLFSLTQERFFNNELKLMHTSRNVTVQSNKIRFENGCIVASFSPIPYEAVIRIEDKNNYLLFTLEDFIIPDTAYKGLSLATPPAVKVRFLQLKLREMTYFGEWLNVCHDDSTAVAVVGPKPHIFIGNETDEDGRLLYAEALKGISFKGSSAALFVSDKLDFLDNMKAFENDFSLPNGVDSRRSDKINSSVYWVCDATPDNIDSHVDYAVRGGFSMMLMYYTCFFKEEGGYLRCGDYELRDEYKNGFADIRKMLDKLASHGITPGLHFLHSHIGLKSKYFTPEADYRVMHRQILSLCNDLDETATELYVDNYPYETDLPEKCRILRFGTELMHYESCTDTPPYCYKGLVRGYNGTKAQNHPRGSCGGVVFISEFGGTSGYCDQTSSLQDELSEKIAEVYNLGFRFVYMDGSEGVNAPYEYQIPLAQYRVYSKFNEAPLFCEAAAKGHFSWHMLSGGNAFDVFGTDIFKAMIDKYPLYEAPRMQMDFTRLNFGWWAFFNDSRPDVFEYGTSHAAGYDCPVTIQSRLKNMKNNARIKDNLEVFRRWEYARANNTLTDEQKRMIREPGREFILLKNYELQEYFPVETAVDDITVYRFTRNGKNIAVLCHDYSSAELFVPIKNCVLRNEIDGDVIETQSVHDGIVFHLGNRCYLETDLTDEEITEVFKHIKLL
jgi:hypothetical protein